MRRPPPSAYEIAIERMFEIIFLRQLLFSMNMVRAIGAQRYLHDQLWSMCVIPPWHSHVVKGCGTYLVLQVLRGKS